MFFSTSQLPTFSELLHFFWWAHLTSVGGNTQCIPFCISVWSHCMGVLFPVTTLIISRDVHSFEQITSLCRISSFPTRLWKNYLFSCHLHTSLCSAASFFPPICAVGESSSKVDILLRSSQIIVSSPHWFIARVSWTWPLLWSAIISHVLNVIDNQGGVITLQNDFILCIQIPAHSVIEHIYLRH